MEISLGNKYRQFEKYISDKSKIILKVINRKFLTIASIISINYCCAVRLGSHTSIRTSMLIHSLGLESHAGVKGHPVQKRRTPLTAANAPRFTASTSSSTSPTVTSEENEDSHSSSSASSSSGPLHAPTITITSSSSSISSKTQCQRCDAVAVAPTPPANGLNVPAQLELQLLKNEMHKANATISALQEREKQMMARSLSSSTSSLINNFTINMNIYELIYDVIVMFSSV